MIFSCRSLLLASSLNKLDIFICLVYIFDNKVRNEPHEDTFQHTISDLIVSFVIAPSHQRETMYINHE